VAAQALRSTAAWSRATAGGPRAERPRCRTGWKKKTGPSRLCATGRSS